MNHIGLFEGIGGFSLAAEWMGWETIAWCEINGFCQKILKQHFPKAIGHGDIKTTDFSIYRGQCDIVTGGFPCTQTSVSASIHNCRTGLAGKDSGLWFEYLRALREIGSNWGIAENVAGIKKWDNIIQKGLEDLGYTVSRLEFEASDFGLPHKRRRYFYVANAHGQRLEVTRQKRSPAVKWHERLATSGGSWLSGTPGVIGGFNGLPNRVDRVRSLGNSASPIMILEIFKEIEKYEQRNQPSEINGLAH